MIAVPAAPRDDTVLQRREHGADARRAAAAAGSRGAVRAQAEEAVRAVPGRQLAAGQLGEEVAVHAGRVQRAKEEERASIMIL